jgi:DNA polymerase-3 subunit alpha
MGIDVLPPDINESFREFTLLTDGEKERIRFGLGSIKNFGEGIADFIIAERKKGGSFKTIEEFLSRVHDRNSNKKSLEALIKSGAMDALGFAGQSFRARCGTRRGTSSRCRISNLARRC